MSTPAYVADRYLDLQEVLAFCERAAASLPEWVTSEEIGHDRDGKPIVLLTIGRADADRDARPAIWIDAGTHASEFTGVMAAVRIVARWLEGLAARDPQTVATFSESTAYVVPLICAGGFDHVKRGGPVLRSTRRAPRSGEARSGFEAADVDGDGRLRLMRWRHPAGSFVDDGTVPGAMRPRTLDDRADDAWMLAPEGHFVAWDGVRWTAAPLRHGLDLNRNFSSHWSPFSMFGMDGGAYALSEPESRAVTDAVAARPNIGAALTLHTYTGCILTQPYRADSPLSDADLDLMEALATDLVADTGYRVFRVHPDFTYDPKKPIVGVWADTLSTVFGVPGYTVELWDPFGFADTPLARPAEFFRRPDAAQIGALMRGLHERQPGSFEPWRAWEHPQLGPVDIGGIDYLFTIRNPPAALLAAECRVAERAADRLMRALPRVSARVDVETLADDAHVITLVLENLGMLPTSGLALGETLPACPGVSATITAPVTAGVVGATEVAMHHMDGWGTSRVGSARNAVYPSLPGRGHRAIARWTVRGTGDILVSYRAGRAGHGVLTCSLERA